MHAKHFLLPVALFALICSASAAIYYVDPSANGSDSYAGTSAQPWKTLAKAQSKVVAGDTVKLRTGNYGAFNETLTASRTNWITYEADTGASPVFTKINVSAPTQLDAYLRFKGIAIRIPYSWYTDNGYTNQYFQNNRTIDGTTYHNWPTLIRDQGPWPGFDASYAYMPKYAPVTTVANTFDASGKYVVYLYTDDAAHFVRVNYIELNDCEIRGLDKILTNRGVYLDHSDNSTITHCNIHQVFSPIATAYSRNSTLTYNHLHDFYGSAMDLGSPDLTIDRTDFGTTTASYNNIENQKVVIDTHDDEYCYEQMHQGSGIALRLSGSMAKNDWVNIRNNIIHNIIGQAIMFYEGTFENMRIENNLIYDAASKMLTMRGLKGTTIVRNNTIVSSVNVKYADASGFHQRYTAPLAMIIGYYPMTWLRDYSGVNGTSQITGTANMWDNSTATYAIDSSVLSKPFTGGSTSLDQFGDPITITLANHKLCQGLRIAIAPNVPPGANNWEYYSFITYRLHNYNGSWSAWSSPAYIRRDSWKNYSYLTLTWLGAEDIDQIEMRTMVYHPNGTNNAVENYIYDIQFNDYASDSGTVPVYIYNNIIVGRWNLPNPQSSSEGYSENYNIWYTGFDIGGQRFLKGNNSFQAYSGFYGSRYHGYPEYFEKMSDVIGTPNATFTSEYPSNNNYVKFFVNPNTDTSTWITVGIRPPDGAAHGQTLDYHLAAGSPGINFGDATNQPSDSLGRIDAEGFILNDGPARDSSHHSAGAYEFGGATTPCTQTQLTSYLSQWKAGSLQMAVLMQKIAAWKAGTAC